MLSQQMEAGMNVFLMDVLCSLQSCTVLCLQSVSAWSQTSIDSTLVGWQVGLAVGRPACLSAMSATLDAPSLVWHRTKFSGDKHMGKKPANTLQAANMFSVFPVSWSYWVNLCLLPQKGCLSICLTVCVYLPVFSFLPRYLASGSISHAVITSLSSSLFSVHQSTLIDAYLPLKLTFFLFLPRELTLFYPCSFTSSHLLRLTVSVEDLSSSLFMESGCVM